MDFEHPLRGPGLDRTRSRRRTLLWLVGVALLALAAGGWIRDRNASRRLAGGEAIARQVAELARAARAAPEDPATAALLDEALALLRATEGGTRSAPYATLLAERAALELHPAAEPDPERYEQARALLDEAWAVADLPPPLRSRIARDQGALAVLAGDLTAAERWYLLATDGSGTDEQVSGTIEVLQRLPAAGTPRE